MKKELEIVKRKGGRFGLFLGTILIGTTKTEKKAGDIMKLLNIEFEERHADGYDDGHIDGYDEGRTVGYDEGRDAN